LRRFVGSIFIKRDHSACSSAPAVRFSGVIFGFGQCLVAEVAMISWVETPASGRSWPSVLRKPCGRHVTVLLQRRVEAGIGHLSETLSSCILELYTGAQQ
jgi:hypothetical protein